MARPRIFISSTYFDLKSIREDLDRFVTTYGFEPVRHERAHISYGRDEKPEQYAYREIELCDIVVSIVGSKFGSQAQGESNSISQKELLRAHELGKQVYIFLEKGVAAEYRWYSINKEVAGVVYSAVSDIRIYKFVEEIYALPVGNPIFEFETGLDIANTLREQWAGLFHRLLGQDANRAQANVLSELQRSLNTVDQMVRFLSEEKTAGAEAISEILFANHPIFAALRRQLNNKYRIYFTNIGELDVWLNAARSYRKMDGQTLLSPDFHHWYKEYTRKDGQEEWQYIEVAKELFTSEGALKPMLPAAWKEAYLRCHSILKDTAPEVNALAAIPPPRAA